MTLATRPETIRGTCRKCHVDTYLRIVSRTQGGGTKVRCGDCGETWTWRPGAYGVRRRRYTLTPTQITAYTNRTKTVVDLAADLGCSPTTIRDRLREAGALKPHGSNTITASPALAAWRAARAAKSRRDYLLAVELRQQGLTWPRVAQVLGFVHGQSAADLVRRHRTKEPS